MWQIPNIGVIENMSGLKCPKCGTKIDLFGSGGGKKQAEELLVSFLGELPMDIEARKMADIGRLIVNENSEAGISIAIMDIVKKIENILDSKSNSSESL